jgi:hypothetical protein
MSQKFFQVITTICFLLLVIYGFLNFFSSQQMDAINALTGGIVGFAFTFLTWLISSNKKTSEDVANNITNIKNIKSLFGGKTKITTKGKDSSKFENILSFGKDSETTININSKK